MKRWYTRYISRAAHGYAGKQRPGGVWIVYRNKRRGF